MNNIDLFWDKLSILNIKTEKNKEIAHKWHAWVFDKQSTSPYYSRAKTVAHSSLFHQTHWNIQPEHVAKKATTHDKSRWWFCLLLNLFANGSEPQTGIDKKFDKWFIIWRAPSLSYACTWKDDAKKCKGCSKRLPLLGAPYFPGASAITWCSTLDHEPFIL